MRTCTKIMALLGLTATCQAAKSFNTQISVSAQQERAANLAQTSTAADWNDQKSFYDMANDVIDSSTLSGYTAYVACYYKANGEYLDEFLDNFYDLEYDMQYICQNFTDELFYSFNMHEDEQYFIEQIVSEACYLGNVSYYWQDQINQNKALWYDFNVDYCYYMVADFVEVIDDVYSVLCGLLYYCEQDYNNNENISTFSEDETNYIQALIIYAYVQCEYGNYNSIYNSLYNLTYYFSNFIYDINWLYLQEYTPALLPLLITKADGLELAEQLYDWTSYVYEYNSAPWYQVNGFDCKDVFEPFWVVIDEIENFYDQAQYQW